MQIPTHIYNISLLPSLSFSLPLYAPTQVRALHCVLEMEKAHSNHCNSYVSLSATVGCNKAIWRGTSVVLRWNDSKATLRHALSWLTIKRVDVCDAAAADFALAETFHFSMRWHMSNYCVSFETCVALRVLCLWFRWLNYNFAKCCAMSWHLPFSSPSKNSSLWPSLFGAIVGMPLSTT